MTGDFKIVITNRSTGQGQTVFISEAELEDLRLTLLRNPSHPERSLTREELRDCAGVQAQLARALAKLAHDAKRNLGDWRENIIGDMDL